MEHKIRIQQNDGYTTWLYPFYTTADSVVGSVVILHGMAEHHERYLHFAFFLNQNGFDVYLYDHRGHGTTQKLDDLGYFGNYYGYQTVIDDAIEVLNYVKSQNRSKKLFLFGHSMGSLIARNVTQTYQLLDGVILSGSTYPPFLKTLSGKTIASLICLFYGKRHRSNSLSHLLFGGRKYSSLCKRTSFDWLTRNNPLIGVYINDPYCGFLCTASFYKDLICLADYASRKKRIQLTKKDLPILLISGDQDAVSNYGKEILSLHKMYQTLGFTKVTYQLYPNCRHELLNELNDEEVFADILTYLKKH